MWKRLRTLSRDDEQSSSDTLSDLSLSMVGVMVIAFTGYILKFRSETVAQAASPTPPAATEPYEEAIQQLQKELRNAKHKSDYFEQQAKRRPTPNSQPQLFGLKGPMSNVVFCLDLSGSMVGQQGQVYSQSPEELARRFQRVKDRLKKMVQSLEFQNFTVIGFGGNHRDQTVPRLHASTTSLTEATPASRDAACQHIDAWQAFGGTPTLPALKAAYAMPGVEHVVLLTDGLPTLEGTQEDVLNFVKQNGGLRKSRGRTPGVVIDVIGIGDQSVQGQAESSMALLDFTRNVANATGGFFQAW